MQRYGTGSHQKADNGIFVLLEDAQAAITQAQIDTERVVLERLRSQMANMRFRDIELAYDPSRRLNFNEGVNDCIQLVDSFLHKASSALNAASFKECRHCGWECRPNQAQSHKWYPLNDPTSSHPSPLLAEPLVQTVQCKAVPDGFVLVPIEPTEEMIAGVATAKWSGTGQTTYEEWRRLANVARYKAMIAAAPKPLAPEGE